MLARGFAICLLVWGASAAAQTPSPASAPPPHDAPGPLAGTTAPTATGAPHSCLQFYPPDAVRDAIQGQVTLAFTIKADGSVGDVMVAKSSGAQVLDDAAVACVAQFRYMPAMHEGQPIAVAWKLAVNWQTRDVTAPTPAGSEGEQPASQADGTAGPAPPQSVGRRHFCSSRDYPISAAHSAGGSKTLVAFKIEPDGSVKDITVAQSSGYDDFDNAAMACASNWRYLPARQNGVPVEVPWKASIRFMPYP